MPDPRLTPARPDLAARHLEGMVQAERYADGVPYVVATGVAPVRRAPSPDAALDTQALKGERFTVYDTREGWAWGQLEDDHYVGWAPQGMLAAPGAAPTHRVIVPRTFAFPDASIKTPPIDMLPLGSLVSVVRTDATFSATVDGLFVPAAHVTAIDAPLATDFVAVAEQFLTTPYLWGGKSASGVDCSGLVQIALAACGVRASRDSDMQEQHLGALLGAPDLQNLRRGDLIFWKGHVAIVRDPSTIIHANAFHMMTAIEPIPDAISRIAAAGSAVTSVKRLGRPPCA